VDAVRPVSNPMEGFMPRAFSLICFSNRRAGKKTIVLLPVLLSLIGFSSGFAQAPSLPDTLHLLALRAEFLADDLATTTGNGKFDLSATSTYTVDRPPHNRTYFQHQLLALHNYFNRVSQGRVNLKADVFPLEQDRAYQLAQNMVYYSGQEDKATEKMRWAELLRDALLLAEKDGTIDFTRYDGVIVFHAGVGKDFAFDFDATPYDIQSVYLDYETLLQTVGKDQPNFSGIAVGGARVTNALILPETQNQEGLDLGLLGTMTLLMGSRLGMPSLFNTQTGQAGIGRWGLMDQGSYNFQGLVPAEPSAWEKVYMGWETPVTVRQGESVRIGSSTTKTAPHIIKVPIDSKEYFLIENRVRDRNGDHITLGRDEYGNRVEFDSTGRVVASAPFGVLTRVDEYDFGLPGEGLLIWHIDERRIQAGLAGNTINNDRDRRGVDLVECDGAQDIGYVYNMFDAGYGTENGDYYDAYWKTNESHKIVNDADHVAFSPWSIPNSHAHNNAVTHIIIDQFSDRDTVMSVRIHSDLGQDGFPLAVHGPFGKAGLLTLDLNPQSTMILAAGRNTRANAPNSNDLVQNTAIFAAGRNGVLWAWQGDGQPLPGRESSLFATLADSLDQPLAGLSPSSFHSACLAAAGRSGNLYVWLQQTGSQWSLTQTDLHSRISAGPMLLADESTGARYAVVGLDDGRCILQPLSAASQEPITLDLHAGAVTGLSQYAENGSTFLLATETGLLACCTPSPSVRWQLPLTGGKDHWQPLTADFTSAPGLEIAALSAGGEFWMVDDEGHGERIAGLPTTQGQPAAGDMDEDGLAEILLTDGGHLFAFESTGAATMNFPFHLGSPEGEIALSPVWIKNRTATASWAFAGSKDGLVWGTTRAGRSQPGYPLSAGGGLLTTPVLQDLDRDGDVELLVVGSDQQLYAWSLPLAVKGESWSQWGAGPARTFLLKGSQEPPQPGNELLPAKKTFCYPNPSRDNTTLLHYSLTQDAKAVSIRIFDLAGDLVEELAALPTRAGDHEIAWKLDDVSAGVYIARVEAQGHTAAAVTFVKIAVIK